eukprot:m.356736 g.356736  ORF g.356736 m.356736 type:complete len:371 (+) comp17614_c0_seq1:313-1425(+)
MASTPADVPSAPTTCTTTHDTQAQLYEPQCLVCLEPIPRGAGMYSCTHKCTVCLDCFAIYLTFQVQDEQKLLPQCPGHCRQVKPVDELLETPGLEQSLVDELKTTATLIRDPNSILCPACSKVTRKNGSNPDVQCSHCSVLFCTTHGLGHQGQQCGGSPSIWQRCQTSWWLWRNTRKCPGCTNRIEKNGGCDHMTCRCGHEICWRCGDSYMKNGRRGHGTELFPRPSQLKYQCNDWKMWLKRVLLVTFGVPVGLAALAIAIPLSLPVGLGFSIVRAVRMFQARRRARARAAVQEQRKIVDAPERQLCEALRARDKRPLCLSCEGHTTCSHSKPDASGFCGCGHAMQAIIQASETQSTGLQVQLLRTTQSV